eukprot:66205-Amphidinium_carterae.1
MDAIAHLENFLGQKVKAVPKRDWQDTCITFPLDNTFTFQVKAPNAKYLRKKVGKGIGLDNMDPK